MFKKIRKLLGRFRSWLRHTKCEEEYFIEVFVPVASEEIFGAYEEFLHNTL